MAHRAVLRRDCEMTAVLCVGFAKHHFVDCNSGLRTHGRLLVGWTPILETGRSEDSFSLVPCSHSYSKLTYAADLCHKKSTVPSAFQNVKRRPSCNCRMALADVMDCAEGEGWRAWSCSCLHWVRRPARIRRTNRGSC